MTGGQKIRVLVIDDSSVIRRLITEIVNAESDMEIAGTAGNGRMGLDMISQVKPDVITLDWEMPVMNGLQTLEELRKLHPRLPVIIFSTLSTRGAQTTLEALSRGASDYVTKPSGMVNYDESRKHVSEQLTQKIRTLGGSSLFKNSGLLQTKFPSPSPKTIGCLSNRVDVVAIGCSTGGPNALADVFSSLSKNLSVPILIVQHMPPIFTKLLAERLSAQSGIQVEEAKSGTLLHPGRAWVAPGDFHMVVKREGDGVQIQTHQGPPENSCRPAVDVMFRSVADTYGPHALGVILTGMGQDGLKGCERIREKGGCIFAQDEASSVVWGMPSFVVKSGLAAKILPIQEMGREISKRVMGNLIPKAVNS